MQLTHEHNELQRTTRRIIQEHLDPHIDQWEAEQIFPAHQVMKALGSAGLLGIGKPEEYGGMGLDFSYEMVFAETLGEVRSSGLTSAIGVQSNMCTPALARHGSDSLKREYLRSEEHTSELQSRENLVCRLLLEKKNNTKDKERRQRHPE